MTDDNPAFVDTNILLASTDTNHSEHGRCRRLLDRSMVGSLRPFVCGQVLREYLVVATRPIDRNGFGLSPKKAIENTRSFRACLQVLEETPACSERLETLISKHKLKGKRIHDANIASVMIENGLKTLFTLNPDDFSPFVDIKTKGP